MPELVIVRGGVETVLSFEGERALAALLREAGLATLQPCGGRGVCGKCRVELSGAVSAPSEAEERAGCRLACQARVFGDARAVLPEESAMEQIETGGAEELAPDEGLAGLAAAVDIGTTTVALKLCDRASGRVLAEAACLNPQTAVAADVIGRIGAALAGEGERLRALSTGAVASLLKEACGAAGVEPSAVEEMAVTGNTTMLYLLTGRSPEPLSHAPFAADCLFGFDCALLGRKAYLPPCMAAFVGADISCAVLASGMTRRKETALLCDIGTNGEIALWKEGRLLVSSTAAGPAFEGAGISCGCGSVRGAIDRVRLEGGVLSAHTIGGGRAVGVCGSGLIDAVAALLESEALDETGRLEDAPAELRDGVALTQADIRAVQLAKAAIAAGIRTLLETSRTRPEDVSALYIAGGFGSHLNVESAARIGLIPAALAPRVRVIGNAALAGAQRILLQKAAKTEVSAIAARAEHVDLGGNPRFNANYMDEMLFPEPDL